MVGKEQSRGISPKERFSLGNLRRRRACDRRRILTEKGKSRNSNHNLWRRMYDAARNEHRSPGRSPSSALHPSDAAAASANATNESKQQPHGKLAMLLSPTDEDHSGPSSSFFDVDVPPADPLPPSNPAPDNAASRKTVYNPHRITPAKDMLRPLRPEDLWINPNLNPLRLAKPQQQAVAGPSRQTQNGHPGTKRSAEDDLPTPPRYDKHLRADQVIVSHCELVFLFLFSHEMHAQSPMLLPNSEQTMNAVMSRSQNETCHPSSVSKTSTIGSRLFSLTSSVSILWKKLPPL